MRSKKSGYSRGRVEEFYGRSLTDEEAIVAIPERGEEPALRPRLAEREWELAAMKSLGSREARLSVEVGINYLAEEAREMMFGRRDIPFTSLKRAGHWLSEQLKNSGKYCQDQFELKKRIEKRHPSIRVAIPRVWLPADNAVREAAQAIGIMDFPPPKPEEFHLLDHEFFEAPGEIWVPACTEQLHILADYADTMGRGFASWTMGQCTALILSGQVSNTPRFRVWNNMTRTKVVIECFTSVNRREILELYRLIRKHSGTKRRKSFAVKDLDLIGFIDSHPNDTWKARLKNWNKINKSRRYSMESSLQNAYRRAKGRENLP